MWYLWLDFWPTDEKVHRGMGQVVKFSSNSMASYANAKKDIENDNLE